MNKKVADQPARIQSDVRLCWSHATNSIRFCRAEDIFELQDAQTDVTFHYLSIFNLDARTVCFLSKLTE